MFSNNLISKTFSLGRLIIPHNYFYIPLAGVKTIEPIQLPEKPKKPLSSFFRFMQEHKLVLNKEHPELKVTEIVKKCADDWKVIHPTTRERYDNEYKRDMEIYAKQHLDYTLKLTDEQREWIKAMNMERKESLFKKRNKKKLKNMNKPKKPLGPFLLYLLDQRKIQGRKLGEIMLEKKGAWSNLEESEKSPYIEKAHILMEKYKEDLKNWELLMIEEGHTDLVRSKTLEENRPATARKTAASKKKSGEVKIKNE